MFASTKLSHGVVIALLCLHILTARASAGSEALIHVRAVAVNDSAIAPTHALTVYPGDSFEVELLLSHWGAQDPEGLVTWQIGLSRTVPRYATDPAIVIPSTATEAGFCLDNGDPCHVSIDCSRCTGGPNAGAFCLNNADCSGAACEPTPCAVPATASYFIADFVCSAGSPQAGTPCQADDECPLGACVVRHDFVFADVDARICAVSFNDVNHPGTYRAGCTAAATGAAADGGGEYYAATAIYEVTADALGQFTIAPNSDETTFLTSFSAVFNYTVEPLQVNVLPPPVPGACCDGYNGTCTTMYDVDCIGPNHTWTSEVTCAEMACEAVTGACCNGFGPDPLGSEGVCTDGVIQADCSGDNFVWNKGVLCANVDCAAVFQPIPTVSEWGLVVLTLALLIGIKVRFGRRVVPAVA